MGSDPYGIRPHVDFQGRPDAGSSDGGDAALSARWRNAEANLANQAGDLELVLAVVLDHHPGMSPSATEPTPSCSADFFQSAFDTSRSIWRFLVRAAVKARRPSARSRR